MTAEETAESSLGALTAAERRIEHALRTRETADFRVGDAARDDPARGHAWDASRQVRASILTTLLRDHVPGQPLVLYGARVIGTLDLAHTDLPSVLTLAQCSFESRVVLAGARVGRIDFSGSALYAVDARGLITQGDFDLRETVASQGVRLPDAQIGGRLICSGASFAGQNGVALNADGILVASHLFLDEGFSAVGEVRMIGAEIRGQVDCSTSVLSSANGFAISADGISIRRSLFGQHLLATNGELRLTGAHVGGVVALTGARLLNPDGTALTLDGADIAGSVFLDHGFTAVGTVRLGRSHIGGHLVCTGASLNNPGRDALLAEALTVDGAAFFIRQFSAVGCLRLTGAAITSQLTCRDGRFVNPGGPAISADGVAVGVGLMMRRSTVAGEIRILGAKIGRQLDCSGARFENRGDDALAADGATLDGSAFFGDGFVADGRLRFVGTELRGQVEFKRAHLKNHGGSVLDFERATVRGPLIVQPEELDGSIDLTGTHVTDYFDDKRTWPAELHLLGFTYVSIAAVPDVTVEERIKWLDRNAAGFTPQPYEQLASAYREAGDDVAARQVVVAKLRRRRKTLPLPARVWDRLLDLGVNYGFKAWRTLVYFAVLTAVGAVVMSSRYPSEFDAARPKGRVVPFQPVLYTVDNVIPVINLHQRDSWNPRHLALWGSAVLTVAGWLLTTVIVAAVAGILRRE